MTKAEKTLEKLRRNPRNWRIDDLEVVAGRYGLAVRKPAVCDIFPYRQRQAAFRARKAPNQAGVYRSVHRAIG